MVSQRLAGAPMETNGILAEPGDTPGTMTCWISHQAPHVGTWSDRSDARHGAGGPAGGLPMGRRRLRSEGSGLSGVPGRCRRLSGPRRAGQVGRDPVGRHGVAGARQGLRDDGQARRHQGRQVHRSRRRCHGQRRLVPGDRCDPADADADDVRRRVRHRQGQVQHHGRSSPTPRRSARIAAQAAPKPPS